MKLERAYLGNYISGHFTKVKDPSGEVFSFNPCDTDEAKVSFEYSYEQIHQAVLSAKRSFSSWKRLKPADRYTYLSKYKALLISKKETLALAIAYEIGKPLWEARTEVDTTVQIIEHFINQGSQTSVELAIPDTGRGGNGVVRFVSRGIVAIVSCAHSPLYVSHTHLIPALINGNTIVFKSSDNAPYVAQLVAEIFHEAGIPAGVLNMVHGEAEAGRRLVSDPDVDAIFFRGTFETACKIKKQILNDYWKTFVYETGGKNAALVWNDADYQKALEQTLFAAFVTTGQRFSSTSRILVHEKIFDKFLNDFHGLAKKITVGNALDDGPKAPFMGSLVGEKAVEDYLRFQGIAVREGAEEIMRGKALERETKGYFVSPSIYLIHNSDSKSIYQKSEIYGPNVAFYKIKDLEEAAGIINLPEHNFVTSVYSQSKEILMELVTDVETGLLHWNRPTTSVSHRLPVSGMKMSGNMRPMGSFSGYQCTYTVSCLEGGDELEGLPSSLPRV